LILLFQSIDLQQMIAQPDGNDVATSSERGVRLTAYLKIGNIFKQPLICQKKSFSVKYSKIFRNIVPSFWEFIFIVNQ